MEVYKQVTILEDIHREVKQPSHRRHPEDKTCMMLYIQKCYFIKLYNIASYPSLAIMYIFQDY